MAARYNPSFRTYHDAREAFEELDGYAYDRDDELALLASLRGHAGAMADDDDELGAEDEYCPEANYLDR